MFIKRQNLRKIILILSFLLFPITIYYFSPYLIIDGAISGLATGSLIVFLMLFLSSLIFGRFFCGWLCPAGGLQECCRLGNDEKAKGGKRNWIKYFIWVPWVLSIIFLFINAGKITFDFLYQTIYGISVSEPADYIIYYGVVLLIVIMTFIWGRRSFCHYICWMAPFMIIGKKINNVLKIPSLKLIAYKEKCISCKQCNQKCPMSLDVEQMVQKGIIKNDECILCGECSDICKQKVINYSYKNK